MCGILLIHGPDARQLVTAGVKRLEPRGPDETVVQHHDPVSLGFVRLAINGEDLDGRQPHAMDGMLSMVNGEVFNHRQLKESHGVERDAVSDTTVVLPLLQSLGEQCLDQLDGFFAGVVFTPGSPDVLSLRDYMRKKPLYLGLCRGNTFISSELKALPGCEWFTRLPSGVSRVDLRNAEVESLHSLSLPVDRPDDGLDELVEQAVLKRLPPLPAGLAVFLSGGLDSSVVASVVARHRSDAIYYSLGGVGVPDFDAVDHVCRHLGIRSRRVPLPSSEELPGLLEAVVWATESYNPSIISNGLGTWLLARAARSDGFKVALAGEGADEVFMGYHARLARDDDWLGKRTQLLRDMHYTELRRLDSCSMAHAVEVRCPFLDKRVLARGEALSYRDHYMTIDGVQLSKAALRLAFRGALPDQIVHRPKVSFDVGSGLRGMVVNHLTRGGTTERERLREIWRSLFGEFDERHPHFHTYPAFDAVIEGRGSTHR